MRRIFPAVAKRSSGIRAQKAILKERSQHKRSGGPVVWVHCASLGEYEGALPVLETIRQHIPNAAIEVSFFSPSGYEHVQPHTSWYRTWYLPWDDYHSMHHFIDHIHPDIVLWAEYDWWWHAIELIHQRRIPLIPFNVVFRPGKYPLNFIGRAWLPLLKNAYAIAVRDRHSLHAALERGLDRAQLIGYTRIDRVRQIARQEVAFPAFVHDFIRDYRLLVAGSTWHKDEQLLAQLIQSDAFRQWKLLIAPHDVGASHMRYLSRLFPSASYWTNPSQSARSRVLIVDTIGWLNKLYRLADMAYVGGGFRGKIHSALEPAAYEIPLLWGPSYANSPEAQEFLRIGAARAISNANALLQAFEHFAQRAAHHRARAALREYFKKYEHPSSKLLHLVQSALQ